MHEIFLISDAESFGNGFDSDLTEEGKGNSSKIGIKIAGILDDLAYNWRIKCAYDREKGLGRPKGFEEYLIGRVHASSIYKASRQTSKNIFDSLETYPFKGLSELDVFKGTSRDLSPDNDFSYKPILDLINNSLEGFSMGILVAHQTQVPNFAKYFIDQEKFGYEGPKEALEYVYPAKGFRISKMEKVVQYLD